MRRIKYFILVLLGAFSLVGLGVGSANAWSNFNPGTWIAWDNNGTPTDPINVIVSWRVNTSAATSLRSSINSTLKGQGWFDNSCVGSGVHFYEQWPGNLTNWAYSMSTDNRSLGFGSPGNPPYGDCGLAERNHFRLWDRDDAFQGTTKQTTAYIAVSLESLKGTPRFDGANNPYPPGCPDPVHCLTRDTFRMGRQGLWNSIYHGYFIAGKVVSFSSVHLRNSSWLWNAGVLFFDDGDAWILEVRP